MPVLYRRGLLESTRVTMIAPEYISPNPDQPRRYFDPDGLNELADSSRSPRDLTAPVRPAEGRRTL